MRVKSASFLKTVVDSDGLPTDGLPEVLVVGRSNVGKSSFINRLANQKSLARTSGTPGRTQDLQFFTFLCADGEAELKFHLVDSPGFGFAKLSKDKKQDIIEILRGYLSVSDAARVVVILNDCRREPEAEEVGIRDLAAEMGKNTLIVVTKMDKLKRSERTGALKTIARGYSLQAEDLITSGQGEASDFLERLKPLLFDS